MKQLKPNRNYVYVQNWNGKPLMPTNPARARQLLKSGRAEVVSYDIFTIRLKCWSKGYKQHVTLGVDSGHAHIGICASTQKAVLILLEMILRTDIVKNLSDRRMMRINRRSRKTRYRAPRFKNRIKTKKKGWLPPSIRYKLEKHKLLIKWMHKILLISETGVEICNFDIQKIKNPDIQGVEYQQGEQFDFFNLREYILYRDEHKCTNCYGKSKDKILEVHHIESRKTGGDAPNNLRTLCKTCHDGYHKRIVKLKPQKRRKSFKQSASVNSFKNQLIDDLKELYPNVHYTYGYITKSKRIDYNLEKTHCNDAYCIADNLDAELLDWNYKCRCFRRHNRKLHVMKFTKGHKRRSDIAPYWFEKTKIFTRYDRVLCNGIECFISGSTDGDAYIKDIDYNKTAGIKNAITTNKLKLIRHASHGCLIDKIQNVNFTKGDFCK